MRCALALALCFLCLASLSGQAAPSDTSTSPPEERAQPLPPPASTSPPPSNPTGELATISAGLYETADDLEKLFTALSAWLKAAGLYQTSSELTLTESARLVESGTATLQDLETSLAQASRQLRAKRLELWIWRGLTVIGAGAAVYFCARAL
jgi:hypothetical protein